jgi:hypothetical protein
LQKRNLKPKGGHRPLLICCAAILHNDYACAKVQIKTDNVREKYAPENIFATGFLLSLCFELTLWQKIK